MATRTGLRRLPRPAAVLVAVFLGLGAVGATTGAALGAVGAASVDGPPDRGHRHDGRGYDGPWRDGPWRDGPWRDGPWRAGPGQDAPAGR